MPVIGLLGGTSPIQPSLHRTFIQGLEEAGLIEGRNVQIVYRWAEGAFDRLPELAAELVKLRVTLIVALGVAAARAARTASMSVAPAIPVVFAVGTDPVADGLVNSLNRPGFNVTGATSLNVEMAPKRLQLLKEIMPKARALGVLLYPSEEPQFEVQSNLFRAAAQTIGIQIDILRANTEPEIEAAFELVVQRQLAGLAVGPSILFNVLSERLGALALRHAVPTIFQTREFTSGGGLMSYGSSLADLYHLAGAYAGRVLKGQRPADLPVQQATRIEMIINMKSAKALGLTVPLSLRARADELIE